VVSFVWGATLFKESLKKVCLNIRYQDLVLKMAPVRRNFVVCNILLSYKDCQRSWRDCIDLREINKFMIEKPELKKRRELNLGDRCRCAAVTENEGTLLCNRLPMGEKDSSNMDMELENILSVQYKIH
jgi:hypothetical protein